MSYIKKVIAATLFIFLIASAEVLACGPATVDWVGDTSSDWDDPLNWDGDTRPGNNDNVSIDPSFTGYVNDPVVMSGTGSSFTARDISISGNVTFTVNDFLSGRTLANENNATPAIIIGGTGTLNLSRDLELNNTVTLALSGAGEITVDRNIAFAGDNSALTNSITGNFNVTGDIDFGNGDSNNQLNNNLGSTISADGISYTSDNNTITNDGIINLTNDVAHSTGNGPHDGNQIINNGTFTLVGIDAADDNFTFDNYGTVTMTGTFSRIDAGSAFNNYSGATWNYAGTGHDTDMLLDCNIDGSNTFNYNRSGNQDVIAPVDEYEILLINGGGTKTLAGAVVVNESITLNNGVVSTTAANLLTLNDDATSGSGSSSSYVDGPIQKIGNDAFIFPTGNAGTWARIGITAPANVTDAYTAEYVQSGFNPLNVDGSLTNASAYEYWTLSEDVGSNTLQVQLFWEDASSIGSDIDLTAPAADLVVASYNAGNIWTSEGQSAIDQSAQGSVTSNATISGTDFGRLTYASISGANTLPIELISFSANLVKGAVNLNWKVATELNNDYFTVERSYNARDFTEIAIINGAGNSSSVTKYSITDYPPLSGLVYYRLTQTDFDGQFETFDLISTKYEKNIANIELFPNPTGVSTVNIVVPDQITGNVVVQVSSMTGKKILEEEFNNPEGHLSLGLSTIEKAGIYIVSVRSVSGTYQARLIVE